MADVYFYKNIEFDINGSYTMDFLSASGAFSSTVRDNYFNARLFSNISDNNIYMRESIPTRVAYNIDALRNAGVNYIKYRNLDPTTNRFSIWYYAFIENMEYVDANTTAIVIKIDVLQTYLKDLYDSTYQNVIERCHQDRYDINGEPVFNTLSDIPSGEHELESVKYFNPVNDVVFYLIVATEKITTLEPSGISTFRDCPNIIQNTFNSFFYYLVPAFKDPTNHANDNFVADFDGDTVPLVSLYLKSYVDNLDIAAMLLPQSAKLLNVYFLPFSPFSIRIQRTANTSGGYTYKIISDSDAIEITRAMFTVADTAFTGAALTVKNSDGAESRTLGTFSNTEFIDTKANRNFDYSDIRDPARESKLYTSEYTQFYLSDYNTDKEIKLEHIVGDPGQSEKFIRFDLTAAILGRVSLNVKLFHYEQAADNLKFVTNFSTVGSYETPYNVSSLSEYIHNQGASILGGLATQALGARTPTGAAGAMIGTVMGLVNAERKVDQPLSIVNERASSNALGYYGFMIYAAFPHNYNVICDFWNLFGYPLNEYRKISEVIKSRHWFNYIKTTGAQLPNIAFLPHRIEAERLLNNGVTFWHNRNGNARPFNNYELENAEEY